MILFAPMTVEVATRPIMKTIGQPGETQNYQNLSMDTPRNKSTHSHSYKISQDFRRKLLITVKTLLLSTCLYTLTPYSKNPKQLTCVHNYSNLEFLYFTNQSLYFTCFTVPVGLLCRYFTHMDRKSHLFTLYNLLLPISLTFEIVVTGLFWCLYFIKKELIVNKRFLQPGFETPLLTELGIHLFPLVLLVIDQLDVPLTKTKGQTIFILSYLTVWSIAVIIAGEMKGKYLYGFMELFGVTPNKIAGFIAAIGIFYSIYSFYINYKTKKQSISGAL